MVNINTKGFSKEGKQIIEGLQGILEGDFAPFGEEVPEVDIKSIREKLNMSRPQFADAFQLNMHSVRNWELGLREPSKSIQSFLRLIAADPVDAFNKLHHKH